MPPFSFAIPCRFCVRISLLCYHYFSFSLEHEAPTFRCSGADSTQRRQQPMEDDRCTEEKPPHACVVVACLYRFTTARRRGGTNKKITDGCACAVYSFAARRLYTKQSRALLLSVLFCSSSCVCKVRWYAFGNSFPFIFFSLLVQRLRDGKKQKNFEFTASRSMHPVWILLMFDSTCGCNFLKLSSSFCSSEF